MTEEANAKCDCGGEYEPHTDTPDVFKCRECGEELHAIAGKHLDLLRDLSNDDDPAISDLADAVMSFKPGEKR